MQRGWHLRAITEVWCELVRWACRGGGWDGERRTGSGEAEEDRTLPNPFSLILTDRQNMGTLSETEA